MLNLINVPSICSVIYNKIYIISLLLIIFCYNVSITNSSANPHKKVIINKVLKRQETPTETQNNSNTNSNTNTNTNQININAQTLSDSYPFGKAIFLFNSNGESNQNVYNQLELYAYENSFMSKNYCKKEIGNDQIPTLISNGYKLFFGNSKDYYKVFVEQAKLHPDVMFVLVGESDFETTMVDNSTSTLTNLHAIAWLHWDARLV